MLRGITRGISGPYGASVPPRTRRRRGHIEPLPSGHFRAVVFTGIDPLTRRRRYVKATCATRAALLLSWLSAVEAEVRGAAADLADCERSFEDALRHLPADPQDPELPFLMLSEAHLGRWRGIVLAKLGDDGALDQLYAALPGTRGGSSRAEATLRTDLALALTAAGEHDEAEAQGRRARELIDLLGSVRLRRRLRRLSA